MIHNKEKLHAIGNYLRDRFGYDWYVIESTDSKPNSIMIGDIKVSVKFSEIDDTLLVTSTVGTDTIIKRLQSPMQVINYIITRKYEVK